MRSILLLLALSLPAFAQSSTARNANYWRSCTATVTTNCNPRTDANGILTLDTTVLSAVNNTQLRGQTWNVFGDSISAGSGASDAATTSYAALVAADRGWTRNTQAVGGDRLADQSVHIQATTITAASISSLFVGYNDLAGGVPDATWKAQLLGNYVYLATRTKLPAADAACTKSGAWSADDIWTTVGQKSVTQGDYVQCSAFGSAIYVVFGAVVDAVTQANISIDGIQVASTVPTAKYAGTHSDGHTLFGVRIGGLSRASHVVRVTVGAANASYPLRVVFIAGNDGQLTRTGPLLYTATMYAANSDVAAKYPILNKIIRETSDQLALDGLGVYLTDLVGPCYSATLGMVCDDFDNSVHPDDTGHAIIANTFLATMDGLSNRKPQNAFPQAFQPLATDTSRFTLREDFQAGYGTTSTSSGTFIADTAWTLRTVAASTTASCVSSASAWPYLGNYTLTITNGSITNGQGAVLARDSNSAALGNLTAYPFSATFIFKLGGTANEAFAIGFGRGAFLTAAVPPADWLGIRYSTAAGDTAFTAVASASSTTTNTVTACPVAADTAWHKMQIVSNTPGYVSITLDGQTCATYTANLMTTNATPFVQIVTLVDGAAPSVVLDFIGLDIPTAR